MGCSGLATIHRRLRRQAAADRLAAAARHSRRHAAIHLPDQSWARRSSQCGLVDPVVRTWFTPQNKTPLIPSMGREAYSRFHPISAAGAITCAAALLAITGLPGATYLESAFGCPLAGGIHRFGRGEGSQSSTFSPWRVRSGYSSRSTRLLFNNGKIIWAFEAIVNCEIRIA